MELKECAYIDCICCCGMLRCFSTMSPKQIHIIITQVEYFEEILKDQGVVAECIPVISSAKILEEMVHEVWSQKQEHSVFKDGRRGSI
ncbi:hypothetical protein CKAN_00769600 [Cinnamomum micranthum f. kanehirae]|uniref:Uncharacterized protein n=1 Tax=Cinnamomum micranthum f. kanehirae TaxID=337451 RepID=A0A443NKU9_9MAGN|nr:hypothetical protein CKAN_00769600 [Cinnamomum micranthum f. kanehirae]